MQGVKQAEAHPLAEARALDDVAQPQGFARRLEGVEDARRVDHRLHDVRFAFRFGHAGVSRSITHDGADGRPLGGRASATDGQVPSLQRPRPGIATSRRFVRANRGAGEKVAWDPFRRPPDWLPRWRSRQEYGPRVCPAVFLRVGGRGGECAP